MRIGTKLRQLRDDHKLSQTEVADFIGITQSAYNRKESEQTEFKATEIFKLAELYKIPVQELFPESSCMQIQENKDNANHNGFYIYTTTREVTLLEEQNLLLKESNTHLKDKIHELEQKLTLLNRN